MGRGRILPFRTRPRPLAGFLACKRDLGRLQGVPRDADLDQLRLDALSAVSPSAFAAASRRPL
jgi:hypothetical protein